MISEAVGPGHPTWSYVMLMHAWSEMSDDERADGESVRMLRVDGASLAFERLLLRRRFFAPAAALGWLTTGGSRGGEAVPMSSSPARVISSMAAMPRACVRLHRSSMKAHPRHISEVCNLDARNKLLTLCKN